MNCFVLLAQNGTCSFNKPCWVIYILSKATQKVYMLHNKGIDMMRRKKYLMNRIFGLSKYINLKRHCFLKKLSLLYTVYLNLGEGLNNLVVITLQLLEVVKRVVRLATMFFLKICRRIINTKYNITHVVI